MFENLELRGCNEVLVSMSVTRQVMFCKAAPGSPHLDNTTDGQFDSDRRSYASVYVSRRAIQVTIRATQATTRLLVNLFTIQTKRRNVDVN